MLTVIFVSLLTNVKCAYQIWKIYLPHLLLYPPSLLGWMRVNRWSNGMLVVAVLVVVVVAAIWMLRKQLENNFRQKFGVTHSKP